MKYHDILGIGCFASEEEIEKAYQTKLNIVLEKQTEFNCNELVKKKKKVLDNARNECLAYRRSNVKSRVLMEMKESANDFSSPNRLNNCIPCGPIALCGCICEPFRKSDLAQNCFGEGYFIFCTTCNGPPETNWGNNFCIYDCCFSLVSVLDIALWFALAGIANLMRRLFKKKLDENKEQQRQQEEKEAEERSQELVTTAQNLKDSKDKLEDDRNKLNQDKNENDTNLERAKADFNNFYKRVVGFVHALDMDIDENDISGSICINEYKKELNRLESTSKNLSNKLKIIDDKIEAIDDELLEIKKLLEIKN